MTPASGPELQLTDLTTHMTDQPKTLPSALRDYRRCWKNLALTDIAYKVLAFVILTPVLGLLFQVLVSLSGRTVVADEDIVQFLLEPLGWICLLVVGALWIAIIALEQAALMGVVCAADSQLHLGVVPALLFAMANGWAVLRVTVRIVALSILAAAPFLAVAGVTYWLLLTKFDINFYLTQKPIEFKIAIGIAAVLIAGLAVVLLRLATSWFYALPLVLLEGVRPKHALHVSRDRVVGHRPRIVAWIVAWLLATFLLSALATGVVIGIAQWFVPYVTNTLSLLLVVVGATVFAWLIANLATNLLSTTTFAVIFFRLYANFGCPQGVDASRLSATQSRVARTGFALTKRRLAVGMLIGVVVAGAIGIFAFRSVRTADNVLIIAHRGGSAAAPENTMAAFEQAVAEQTDWTEFDVQETADGQVVVFHDSDFKKLANIDLKIWDATMDDLKSIDIGSWFDPKFKDQRVPTLDEVLTFCKGKTKVTIELKYYGHDQKLEQRVAELVEAHDMQSDAVIISLKQAGLQKMKKLRPQWKTGLLTAVALGNLAEVDADFLAVSANIATRRLIRSAHQRNKKVLVWTVNDPISMSTMIGRGADGLITDRPALAREVIEARKTMSSVERLLLELAGLLGVQREVVEQ